MAVITKDIDCNIYSQSNAHVKFSHIPFTVWFTREKQPYQPCLLHQTDPDDEWRRREGRRRRLDRGPWSGPRRRGEDQPAYLCCFLLMCVFVAQFRIIFLLFCICLYIYSLIFCWPLHITIACSFRIFLVHICILADFGWSEFIWLPNSCLTRLYYSYKCILTHDFNCYAACLTSSDLAKREVVKWMLVSYITDQDLKVLDKMNWWRLFPPAATE